MPRVYRRAAMLAIGAAPRHSKQMYVALIAIFCAGIANFAMHRAFMESDDPLVQSIVGPFVQRVGPWTSYAFEFILLLGALMLAERNGFAGLLLYGLYTIFNAMAFSWIRNRPR
ncbi:MAG: hypothetical protein H2056_08900 [Sphingopyxis sp.]|nr:hypothetical protein [Sphingopyxis sp.]